MSDTPEMPELNGVPNVLACDIGNSSLHLACVQGEQVTDCHVVRIGELACLRELLPRLWDVADGPCKLVASSVQPTALKAFEAAASEFVGQGVLVVGRDLPLPIKTDLPDPASIGTDRLCAAVAAYDRLGAACVVADFGSAVTVDCVNDDGVFLGGAILPGLSMSADCLHECTALLPRVQLAAAAPVFGKNAEQAILLGLLAAARGALRELVEAYATEMGRWPLVILTGGDAELVCPHPGQGELVQAVVPDLTLRGAAIAYYKTLLK